MATFTLREAGLHDPDTLINEIVQQIDQMGDDNRLVTTEVFPLVELSDSVETHFTRSGKRVGMRETALSAESPTGDVEGLGERDVTVETFKKKIQPEKGVDTELNNTTEIYNLFEAAAAALREDLLITRATAAWRGTSTIDGLIGPEGQTAHPEVPSEHVVTPTTAYSDTANSSPITDMIDAEYRINENGSALGETGGVTAYVTPSLLRDLKLNDDIQSEYDNTRALTEQQLADAFQLDSLRTIRTKVPRTDGSGNLLDDAGNQVEEVEDATMDNVLEPYDASDGTTRRNLVIMAPGQPTAFMPFFLDRLNEMGAEMPTGAVSVDSTNGWLTQTWTQPDPMVSWYKAAQEIGFHVMRGENIYVIQDV